MAKLHLAYVSMSPGDRSGEDSRLGHGDPSPRASDEQHGRGLRKAVTVQDAERVGK